jgi:hypothetical protein
MVMRVLFAMLQGYLAIIYTYRRNIQSSSLYLDSFRAAYEHGPRNPPSSLDMNIASNNTSGRRESDVYPRNDVLGMRGLCLRTMAASD